MTARYKLTPLAIEDLQAIWRYGAETWGLAQTEYSSRLEHSRGS